MTEIHWLFQSSPGDIVQATVATGAGADPGDVCAMTSGGHLVMRRRVRGAWRWEQLGTPPGNTAVVGATCLTVDTGGTVVPVVVGATDGHVWLSRPGSTPAWVDLGAPASDSSAIAVGTVRIGGGLRHLLVLASASGRTWMHEGLEAGGTWFSIRSDAAWTVTEVALAFGSSAAGEEPAPHIFAVTRDRTTLETRLRVAVPEGAGWTWIDPGPRPEPEPPTGLSATSFRDGSGVLQACAIVGDVRHNPGGAAGVNMLVGSARTWRWEAFGRPPGPFRLSCAVVAGMGAEPVVGDPIVVARAGHRVWKRSLGGNWEALGTAPGDVAVVDPVVALAGSSPTSPRALWLGGVSWDGRLWAVTDDGTEVHWTDHGAASSVNSVVGTSSTRPDPLAFGGQVHAHLLDEHGRLWRSSNDWFRSRSWKDLGRPSPTTAARTAVGVVALGQGVQHSWTFVLGSDGHLWARSSGPGSGSWVDQGVPPNRRIRACLAPVAAGPGADQACVPVLADDGHVWLHIATEPEGPWIDRGTPPGRLIFTLVGACSLTVPPSGLPLVAVATDDGHLWLSASGGAASTWTDLGAPSAGEKVTAGIGALAVRPGPGAVAVLIVAVGSPSGNVWVRRWAPEGAGTWADLGNPTESRIQAGVGVLSDWPHPADCLVFVVAGDRQLWVGRTAEPGEPWARWGLPHDTRALAGGRAAVLLETASLATAVLIGTDKRLWIPLPPELSSEFFAFLAWAEPP